MPENKLFIAQAIFILKEEGSNRAEVAQGLRIIRASSKEEAKQRLIEHEKEDWQQLYDVAGEESLDYWSIEELNEDRDDGILFSQLSA